MYYAGFCFEFHWLSLWVKIFNLLPIWKISWSTISIAVPISKFICCHGKRSCDIIIPNVNVTKSGNSCQWHIAITQVNVKKWSDYLKLNSDVCILSGLRTHRHEQNWSILGGKRESMISVTAFFLVIWTIIKKYMQCLFLSQHFLGTSNMLLNHRLLWMRKIKCLTLLKFLYLNCQIWSLGYFHFTKFSCFLDISQVCKPQMPQWSLGLDFTKMWTLGFLLLCILRNKDFESTIKNIKWHCYLLYSTYVENRSDKMAEFLL